ncbi:ferredoxin reductase family protein [Wenzhouxiangella marina]|uniref:Oxidoreductase n=1 Tax=Wenzhouxiangella marina TaxID=1579979 RepID=A0A0K0XU51_9GAMM|nr:ferredoxin reductase family protein [Wenzhouxiangella marina]AKS41161.1 oxidoreductase [Wenzhouxiangella marina]MBB6088040.1 putative ferric reductase [Wenzhouxiangella marina]
MISARAARTGVWGLALLPLALFVAGIGTSDLASPAAVLNLFGRLAGVLGLVFLLLAGALSARVPGFDQPFGGLTKLWHTHHLLGAASLMLLLAHPILLALARGPFGVEFAAALLFPPLGDLASWAGWLALALMMVFLAPSFAFFGRPRYERWKRVHALAGPAIVLALVHTALFSRSLPGSSDLVIWGGLSLLAVSGLLWRFLFSRRRARLRHRVELVEPVSNNVVELTLKPLQRRLRYQAGNFVYLTPHDPDLAAGCNEEHPYTLSSSPLEHELRIAIKDLGDASHAIQTITPGSEVSIEGPYGRFFDPRTPDHEPQLWVAGGIGITPFLARLRHLDRQNADVDVVLVFAVQDDTRMLFKAELEALAQRLEGVRLVVHMFYREGPISREFLNRQVPDLARREAWICGPLPLNHLVQSHLRDAGIDRARIHTEEFELL